MRKYYRVYPGKKHVYANECFNGSFIGADFGIEQDLTNELTEDFKPFNSKFIPIYQQASPDKSRVSAGLACGALWTVAKGVKLGDIVLCPDGHGAYWVGEVSGEYVYRPGENLPHRRSVTWHKQMISREGMSPELLGSVGSSLTVCHISKHQEEIDRLMEGEGQPRIFATDPTIEDPSVFALEKHLEDFLIRNWRQTPLAENYDVYTEDGEIIGQQYPTDTGPIDILAISKDKSELLVIELKRGRASDVVIGQVQRYMGYVLEELAEKNQVVKGVIIALEDDLRIRRSLAVAPNIDFYRYRISFDLIKA